MASHMNNSGYSNEGEHDVATPYNRPRPQFEVTRSAPAPTDPTSGLLAEGGFLTLNDRDRAGLNKWFQKSYQNVVAPLRGIINANFDKAFELLRVYDEELVQLRAENATLRADMTKWVEKKDVEFGREVLKIRNENIALKKELTIQTQAIVEVIVERSIDQIKSEFATEILKIQNDVAGVKKSFEVQKIVSDAARVTEQSFEGLRRELATEIAKSREEVLRASRRAAKPTPPAPQPRAPKPAPASASKKGKK